MVVPCLQFLTFLRPLPVSKVETKMMVGFLSMLSFSLTLVGTMWHVVWEPALLAL